MAAARTFRQLSGVCSARLLPMPDLRTMRSAVEVFEAGLHVLQAKLRAGLKAELGAFYPLLLLRPLESDKCDLSEFWRPKGQTLQSPLSCSLVWNQLANARSC